VTGSGLFVFPQLSPTCLHSKLQVVSFVSFFFVTFVTMSKKGSNKEYTHKDKAKYPCSHYKSWPWDPHTRCVYCRVKSGEEICSRERVCDLCTDWPPENWDLYEAKVSNKKLSGTISSPSSTSSRVSRSSRKRRDSSLDSSSSPDENQARTKKYKSRSRSHSMSQSDLGEKSAAGTIPTSASSHPGQSFSSSINTLPNPQDLWNMFTFMHLLSAQKSAGGWPIGPTPTLSMVGAGPNTLRKEGNSDLSTQAYGLVGVGSVDQSLASADISAPSVTGLPVVQSAQRAVSRPPDFSGMPHVCGTIRPGYSSAVRTVRSAVESATTLSDVVGASRMSTGPTGSDRVDQNQRYLLCACTACIGVGSEGGQ